MSLKCSNVAYCFPYIYRTHYLLSNDKSPHLKCPREKTPSQCDEKFHTVYYIFSASNRILKKHIIISILYSAGTVLSWSCPRKFLSFEAIIFDSIDVIFRGFSDLAVCKISVLNRCRKRLHLYLESWKTPLLHKYLDFQLTRNTI